RCLDRPQNGHLHGRTIPAALPRRRAARRSDVASKGRTRRHRGPPPGQRAERRSRSAPIGNRGTPRTRTPGFATTVSVLANPGGEGTTYCHQRKESGMLLYSWGFFVKPGRGNDFVAWLEENEPR